MQSHKHSLIESIANTASGFVISWLVWVFVAAPWLGIPYNGSQGLAVTLLFTVTSLIRSYVVRRIFNRVKQ